MGPCPFQVHIIQHRTETRQQGAQVANAKLPQSQQHVPSKAVSTARRRAPIHKSSSRGINP